mmetsp:Transcript_60356/g.171525  ORF Transcript_60356/g.171525 Transcript_60356/m.171525 type:complete len:447 (+) Transcript_60356:76-1416(+)
MGKSVSRSYMCCSAREKAGLENPPCLGAPPRFRLDSCEVQIAQARLVAFAPLYQREAALTRRVALASACEVHVYRVTDPDDLSAGLPELTLTHTLRAEHGQQITGVRFVDEDNSRDLAVAFGPVEGAEGEHVLQIWNTEADRKDDFGGVLPDEQVEVVQWDHHSNCSTSIVFSKVPITHMATQKGSFFLAADATGNCQLFNKRKNFELRSEAVLHPGGIVDLALDKLFLFSVGNQRAIRVSSVPDLREVLTISVDLSQDFLRCMGAPASSGPLRRPSQGARAPASPSAHFAALGPLRRPCSRWTGMPGAARSGGSGAPRGFLYAAGVLGDACEVAGAGAGVLMEWQLGGQALCRSAQVAHDSPIVLLSHGPYDNGPIITADAKGIFRVWQSELDKGLCFMQQVDLACLEPAAVPAVAVEQPRCLYMVACNKKLVVWRRHQDEFGRM